MAWSAGTRLGPYEILSLLGAGGMGEVYKARDTRLDRTVAIKVLPEALAAEPQFRERFDREARAISQLDHPHICTLYDVGEDRGIAFLVMQYLEGETLADRMRNGPLPLDQALRYAVEIADALDKAHRAGIVHRDLKPGNVFVTKGGAKLLDFGLAKRGAQAAGGAGLSELPTAPDDLTAPGAILGTLLYMAPEQLEGQEADARTDIFALGAVLYEMVTGRRAFGGRTQASVMGAILQHEPPPMSSVQPQIPVLLDHLVSRCLAKDRDDRWQTASDVMRELEWIAHDAASLRADASRGSQAGVTSWRRATYLVSLIVASLVGLVGYLIAGPVFARRGGLRHELPIRISVAPPANTRLSGVQFAMSPDGGSVA
jgi:eukaryotic-like serine/threonine-protein kinase